MEAAIAALKASVAKKDTLVSDAFKRLRPLADEVYDEIMPAKYKRPVFAKFDGSGNPWDHITMFEIECGSIATNDKLKLQQFPSSLTGCAMRWFNNRLHGSIASWETLVELFTAHFQLMEVPVKIKHLKLCTKETKESFREYVQRFRNLALQMKDTPDLKEIVRICAMNSGPASWYLAASPYSTFEDLFERVLTYEELTRSGSAGKAPQFASVNAIVNVNAIVDYCNQSGDRDKTKHGKNEKNDFSSDKHPRKQLRDLKDYTFELKDMERWFDLLLKEGKITPLKPKEPVEPDDRKHEDYCRFHQRIDHSTSICRHLR